MMASIMLRGLSRTILLLLAVLGSVVGCAEERSDVLRFGLSAAPVTLDPRFATDAASTRIDRLLYQRLVDFDERFQPVPALAKWAELSPTHYRFTLTPTHKFALGRLPRAEDVKATYDSVLNPGTASPHRGSLASVKEVVVVDPLTVDFHLNNADPLFPGRLVIGIIPAEKIASGERLSRHPDGSGAFEFVDWNVEGRLTLRRRADGQIIEFLHVPNPTVRALKLGRGEIDMLQGDMPMELVRWLADQPHVRVGHHAGTNFAYLGFNLEDPVVGQLAVRQAIAHGIDRQSIIDYVLAGHAERASALLTPDHWAGNQGLKLIDYDPDKAKSMLQAAGYGPGNELRIVYKTSNNPLRVRLATIIQQQLADIGIVVDLKTHDWGTFYGDVKAGNFQMYSLAWVGIKIPDIFRYVFHSESIPPAGANRGRLADKHVDGLIEKAEAASTLQAQAVHFRALQSYLLRQLPYVPLWYEDQIYVGRKDVHGYTLARDGNYDGLTYANRSP